VDKLNLMDLSWSQLRETLNDCQDQKELERWLTTMTAHGSFTRVMRVYGRLSTVRRQNEVAALKMGVMAAQRSVEDGTAELR